MRSGSVANAAEPGPCERSVRIGHGPDCEIWRWIGCNRKVFNVFLEAVQSSAMSGPESMTVPIRHALNKESQDERNHSLLPLPNGQKPGRGTACRPGLPSLLEYREYKRLRRNVVEAGTTDPRAIPAFVPCSFAETGQIGSGYRGRVVDIAFEEGENEKPGRLVFQFSQERNWVALRYPATPLSDEDR